LKKEETKTTIKEEKKPKINIASRTKGLNNFWDKFKDSLIDMFKEEEDKVIK
jgi:hypothetical protein